MLYSIYSFRDKYTQFAHPAIDENDMAAKRNFAYMVNNNPGVMNFEPSDFDFYRIGTFDSKTGEIRPVSPIEFICNGQEVFNEK